MSTHDARSFAMPVTHAAIDDAVSRTATIAGLTGVALIHVLQLPDAFSETFYLGLLFVGAVVAAVLVAAALTRTSGRRVWTAAFALPALILLGYLLSRTTGLPDATNDVGEWDEPLGLASMVAETLVVCVSGVVPPGSAAGRRRSDFWTGASPNSGAPCGRSPNPTDESEGPNEQRERRHSGEAAQPQATPRRGHPAAPAGGPVRRLAVR
jgi:hypothetical protein